MASSTQGNEVFFCRRTSHAPRDQVVDMQLEIDVIHRPTTAYHAPVLIPFDHPHTELRAGGTTLYRVVGEVPSSQKAETANL